MGLNYSVAINYFDLLCYFGNTKGSDYWPGSGKFDGIAAVLGLHLCFD
jgi:hypothetical protein